MAVVLRPYQDKAVHEVRTALREPGVKNVLLQMPTGAGKTITSGHIMGSAADRGNDGWFICNRVELLDQTGKAFDKLGIRHSYIAPDYRPDYTARTQIASIDTLKGRIRKGLVKAPKLVVWDECRSIAAKGWADVHAWLAEHGTLQLGLDATPERHDGKPLGPYVDQEGTQFEGFFQRLVHGPSYSELVELGNLVPFECYAPTRLDLSKVRQKGFDFDKEQLEAEVDKPSIIGDVVDSYIKHASGLRGLTFAVSRKHSQHLADAYNAAGVPAMHLDGDTDPHARREAVKAFRRGDLLQLVNVDLFVAGFDVPGVRVISDACPTASLPRTLQKWGRGSRPDEDDPSKTFCILLDHANNMTAHGFPDDDRTWSLDGRPPRTKKQREEDAEAISVNMRQCEACFHSHKPAPACPKCGEVYPIQYRSVDELEGELKKVSKEELRAMREAEKAAKALAKLQAAKLKEEQKRLAKASRSLEELQRIETERGYNPGWARGVWQAKIIARDRIGAKIAEAQYEAYRR